MKNPKPLSRAQENAFRKEVERIRNARLVDEINKNQPNKISKLKPKTKGK